MNPTRRSLLSAIGVALPLGIAIPPRARRNLATHASAPVLRFRSFEEAVRAVFQADDSQSAVCHRIEIGHSDQVRAGIQGCHNDRPFAGFPAGSLRILRIGSEPGPIHQGVRLYISTVDVARTNGMTPGVDSRPLDFAALPPAPILA